MRSLQIITYGKAADALQIMDSTKPKAEAGELLVKVMACSINPVDYKTIHGHYKLVQRFKFPVPIGYDFSGVVEEVGKGVSQYKAGDKVFGCLPAHRPGSLAEYCICPIDQLYHMPSNLSFEEAATLPLAGMTAIQCFSKVKTDAGRVLIQAGSGGVGSLAIQYARSLGWHVISTTSSKNEAWVSALGAHEVISYDKTSYDEELKGLDMVLDSLGGAHSFRAAEILRKGGYLINIAGGIDSKAAKQLGVSWVLRQMIKLQRRKIIKLLKSQKKHYAYVLMMSNSKDLKTLKEAVEKGVIVPQLDKTYEFEQAKEAFTYLESQRVRGKLVIRLADDRA